MNSKLPPQELPPALSSWIAKKYIKMQSAGLLPLLDLASSIRLTTSRIEACPRRNGKGIEHVSELFLRAGMPAFPELRLVALRQAGEL